MRNRSIAVVFFMTVLVGCGDSGSDSGGTGGAGGSTGGQSGRGGSGGSAATGGAGGSAGSGGSGGSAGSAGGSSGTGGTGGSAATGGAGGTGGGASDAGGKESGSGDGSSGEAGGNPSADTWASFGMGFMVKYCVSCHNDDNAGVTTRNYRMLTAVMREKVEIACGTAKSAADRTARGCGATSPRARQFPVGNGAKPTDEERDRLLRWIDAGTP
jgi:hypothetical protein